MRRSVIAALAVGLTAGLLPDVGLAPISAQTDQGAVCLSGTAKSTGQMFTFLAPISKVDGLLARGFQVEPCQGKDLQVATYKAEICGLSQSAPADVKQGLVLEYGIGPDEMCQLVSEID